MAPRVHRARRRSCVLPQRLFRRTPRASRKPAGNPRWPARARRHCGAARRSAPRCPGCPAAAAPARPARWRAAPPTRAPARRASVASAVICPSKASESPGSPPAAAGRGAPAGFRRCGAAPNRPPAAPAGQASASASSGWRAAASGWPARTASTSGSVPSISNHNPSMAAGSSMRPSTTSRRSAFSHSISGRFMPVCTATAMSGWAWRKAVSTSNSRSGTTLGRAPSRMRSTAAGPSLTLRAASSRSSSTRSAWRRKRMPAAVRSVPARLRTSRRADQFLQLAQRLGHGGLGQSQLSPARLGAATGPPRRNSAGGAGARACGRPHGRGRPLPDRDGNSWKPRPLANFHEYSPKTRRYLYCAGFTGNRYHPGWPGRRRPGPAESCGCRTAHPPATVPSLPPLSSLMPPTATTLEASPQGEPGNGSLSLRILAIVFFNFVAYLAVGLPIAVVPGFVHDSLGYGTVRPAGRQHPVPGHAAEPGLCRPPVRCPGPEALSGDGPGAVRRQRCPDLVAGLFAHTPALGLAWLFAGRLVLGAGGSLVTTGTIAWGIGSVGARPAGSSPGTASPPTAPWPWAPGRDAGPRMGTCRPSAR